jgi:hypothetical protein
MRRIPVALARAGGASQVAVAGGCREAGLHKHVELGTGLSNRPAEGAPQFGRARPQHRLQEASRGKVTVAATADIESAAGEIEQRRGPPGAVVLHPSGRNQQVALQLQDGPLVATAVADKRPQCVAGQGPSGQRGRDLVSHRRQRQRLVVIDVALARVERGQQRGRQERAAPAHERSVPGKATPRQLVLPGPHLLLVRAHPRGERFGGVTGDRFPQRGCHNLGRREQQRVSNIVHEGRRSHQRPDASPAHPPPSGTSRTQPNIRSRIRVPRARHSIIEAPRADIDTIKPVRPAPGKTDGSSETAIAILPPAAAHSSPIRALLGGRWLLRTVSGLPAGQVTNLDPTVVLTLNALPPNGLTAATAACHTTTAIATATTFTFQKPWDTVADGCPDLSSTQAGWLYTRLLAGTVNWHAENATITITKPGLGTATFLYRLATPRGGIRPPTAQLARYGTELRAAFDYAT